MEKTAPALKPASLRQRLCRQGGYLMFAAGFSFIALWPLAALGYDAAIAAKLLVGLFVLGGALMCVAGLAERAGTRRDDNTSVSGKPQPRPRPPGNTSD